MITFPPKIGGHFSRLLFWILISPFFTSHCRAATRQATEVMTDFSARVEIGV